MSKFGKKRGIALGSAAVLAAGIGIGVGIDRTPPVLEATGASFGYGEKIAVTELVTAEDNRSETVDLIIESGFRNSAKISNNGKTVQFDKPGNYALIVKGTDESNNEATLETEVSILDTTPPFFTSVPELLEFEYGNALTVSEEEGENVITVKAEDEVSDVTYEISDIEPSSGFSSSKNRVTFSDTGSYLITVKVIDESGNQTAETIRAEIFDKTAPVLTGIPEKIQLSEYDNEKDYLEDVTAEDEVDGDLTEDIDVDSSAVKYGVPGTYTVKYIVKDQSGNKTSASSKVVVKDTTAPNISLDKTTYSLTTGDSAPDYMAAVTAKDALDKNVKVSVDDSEVNYNKAGTYTVTYSAFDSSGNKTTKSAKVVVENPVIELAPAASTYDSGSSSSTRASVADSFSSVGVYITETGEKYHRGECRYLKDSQISISKSDAIARGYEACKVCHP